MNSVETVSDVAGNIASAAIGVSADANVQPTEIGANDITLTVALVLIYLLAYAHLLNLSSLENRTLERVLAAAVVPLGIVFVIFLVELSIPYLQF